MRSQLQIERSDGCLLVRVKTPNNPRGRWLVAAVAVAALLFYFVLRLEITSRKGELALLSLLGIGILIGLVNWARGTNVELKVHNLNFISRGHAPGGYGRCQVSRVDLMKLEFRPSSGGGEDPELPSGLYVEYDSDSTGDTSVCVLPHLDEEQTGEVIAAIRKQFPEIEQITYARFRKSGLISLDLNR